MFRNRAHLALPLAALLGFAGCLVSPNPFYEKEDVIRDDTLLGTYIDRQETVFWKAVPSPAEAGRYEILLSDHGAISHFFGTLFRLDGVTYLDLEAIGQVAVYVDPRPVTGVPTVSQRMGQLVGDMHDHLVLRVAISPAGVTYWFAAPDILKHLPKEETGPPSSATTPNRVVLERPTRDLRALLRKYGSGDMLFSQKTILERYQPGQPAHPRRGVDRDPPRTHPPARMNFINRLIGKTDIFFDLLEGAADEVKVSVDLFVKFLGRTEAQKKPALLDEFLPARRKEKRIRHTMTEALASTFVTPIDREDIEALSAALYRIPKQVEKIVERLSIYPGPIPHAMFSRQAELMVQAATALVFMVKQLRLRTGIEAIREANDRLQLAEAEADKVMLEHLRELYHGACGAKELVILQKIFEMTEQTVDRCRNAGAIVVQVVLKQS